MSQPEPIVRFAVTKAPATGQSEVGAIETDTEIGAGHRECRHPAGSPPTRLDAASAASSVAPERRFHCWRGEPNACR